MTEGDENLFFEKEENVTSPDRSASVSSKHNMLKLTVTAVAMFILAVGFGVLVGPAVTQRMSSVSSQHEVAQPSTVSEARFADLEKRLKVIEDKQTSTDQPVTQGAATDKDLGDLASLKTGLIGLAESLSKLQDDLSKTTERTTQVSVHTGTGLASVVAYLQMHTAAFLGKPYEAERQTLRSTLVNDAPAQAIIERMEKDAVSGVPTIQALQSQFEPLALEAQMAIRKAAAKTWQDRIIVGIESLVSIGKLSGAGGIEPLAIKGVHLDLANDKLQTVIDKIDSYPPEAKEILKSFREQVVQRLEAENNFATLAASLIEHMTAQDKTPAPETQSTEAASEPPKELAQ